MGSHFFTTKVEGDQYVVWCSSCKFVASTWSNETEAVLAASKLNEGKPVSRGKFPELGLNRRMRLAKKARK